MAQQTFGEVVKLIRERQGVSLRALAKDAGMSAAYLSDIENNRRYAPVGKKMDALLGALQLDADTLAQLHELIGFSRKAVAPDMTEFLQTSGFARMLVRQMMQANDFEGGVLDHEEEASAMVKAIKNFVAVTGGVDNEKVMEDELA